MLITIYLIKKKKENLIYKIIKNNFSHPIPEYTSSSRASGIGKNRLFVRTNTEYFVANLLLNCYHKPDFVAPAVSEKQAICYVNIELTDHFRLSLQVCAVATSESDHILLLIYAARWSKRKIHKHLQPPDCRVHVFVKGFRYRKKSIIRSNKRGVLCC